MGIYGLETFMEQLGNAIYETSIAEMAQNYRDDMKYAGYTDTEDVKILVDTETCQHVTFEFTGQFRGYAVREYVNQVRVFVEEFRKLHIEPVFFFNDWMSIKAEERQASIANVAEAFDCLMVQNRLPHSYHLVLPSWRFTSACILHYVLGCEVRYVRADESSREAILKYIQENKLCFAILTTNTEFVACQTDAIVLSSSFTMNSDMRTRYYNRKVLAAGLEISVEELPLLAIMAGKDTEYTSEEIESFHSKCLARKIITSCLTKKQICDLLKKMAASIRERRKIKNIELVLENLCSGIYVMGSTSKIKLLKKRYHSYFPPHTDRPSSSIDLRTTIEDRYRTCKISTDVYTVLRTQELRNIANVDDFKYKYSTYTIPTLMRDQPSYKVLRPLRQRLYGVLLSEKKSTYFEPITVTEWKSEAKNRNTRRIHSVCPTKPVVHHPGLMELWADVHDDIVLNNVRWTLFLKTISPSLDVARWQSFDRELLFPTLSVYHLYTDTKYLDEDELDAVLVTIAIGGTCPEVLPRGYFNDRICNISIALYKTFTLVLNILAACGYPIQLSENNAYLKFESRLFRVNYFGTMENETEIRRSCLFNDDVYDKFKRMKDIINETMNDKTSHSLSNGSFAMHAI